MNKCLILVTGTPGAGKTTLARRIAGRLHAVYLCSDSLSESFFPDDRESAAYREARDRIYAAFYRIAEDNLRCGLCVVLDAPHVKPMADADWRRTIAALAESTESELKVVRVKCSPEQLRMRIEKRGEARDAAKLLRWDEFLKDQPLDASMPPGMPSVDIDTESDLETQFEKARSFIQGSAGPT